jgi:hypothetical protein
VKEQAFIVVSSLCYLPFVALNLFNSGKDDLADVGSGNRVVKGRTLRVPLVGEVAIAVLNQRGVDRKNVLLSANALHVSFCRGKHHFVGEADGQRVPTLADLRVFVT